MKRPWYHLHVVTCLALCALCVALAWVNGHGPSFNVWPVGISSYDPPRLISLTNIAALVSLVVGTLIPIECWTRSPNRLSIRLKSVFILFGLVSAVLAFWRLEQSVFQAAEDGHLTSLHISDLDLAYLPIIAFQQWPVAICLYFSLACTAYTALLLGTGLAGWSFRFVARRFRSPGGSA